MAHGDVFDSAVAAWIESRRPTPFASVFTAAADANRGRKPHLVAETVFVDHGQPLNLIKPINTRANARHSVRGVEVVQLRDAEGAWHILALPTSFDGVFHLVAGVPTTHSRWQKVVRWISSAKDVSRCYLNHTDFANIAIALQEFGKVEVGHASGRDTLDGSSTNRGYPARGKAGRRNPLDQILEFEERNTYTRSWTLHVGDQLSFHLRRLAGATFYTGSFRLFEDQVLNRLAEAARDRRQLLAGRQRERSMPVVPLSIILARDVFNTREETGQLIDAVQEMADMSMAVFHRNPYLHFMLADERDGSNFDVVVTVPNAIDVFPGFRASASSLARVTGRLAEAFGALRIEEARPQGMVSLADLGTV